MVGCVECLVSPAANLGEVLVLRSDLGIAQLDGTLEHLPVLVLLTRRRGLVARQDS